MENWGYIRVSTTQDKQSASWDDQSKMLSKFHVTQFFREEASAGGPRPVFGDMLDKAIAHADETGEPVHIHVQKMDRAFRDLEQTLKEIKRVARRLVFFVLHDISPAPLDPKNPAQALLVSILGAISQFEKDRFTERRSVGIAKAKKEGKYKGRQPTARAKSDEILQLRERKFKIAEIVKLTGVGQASVYRILADHRSAAGA